MSAVSSEHVDEAGDGSAGGMVTILLVLGGRHAAEESGTIHLTGPDSADPVKIEANYLGDPADLKGAGW